METKVVSEKTEDGSNDVRLALPFTVRPMREKDLPVVMAIEQHSFPSPWPESAYRYELRFGMDSRFYVLQLREERPPATTWRGRLPGSLRWIKKPPVLGYVGLRLRGREAHISTIAVHPDWRRRGLGEFLLAKALEAALHQGVRRVTLEVRPSNWAARQLYAKVGFVEVGVRRAYYRNGEDGCVMALGPLDAAAVIRLRDLRRAATTRLMREGALRNS